MNDESIGGQDISGINRIRVSGFKSLYDPAEIEIRPLTVLAGANSSGKSSIMQPLLLMKQTLEATYDPGVFKLDGPNVYFSAAEQFFSKGGSDEFVVSLEKDDDKLEVKYELKAGGEIDIIEMSTQFTYDEAQFSLILKPGMSTEEIVQQFPQQVREEGKNLSKLMRFFEETVLKDPNLTILPHRSLLRIESTAENIASIGYVVTSIIGISQFQKFYATAIHVPGIRKQGQRTYPTTHLEDWPSFDGRVLPRFVGTFENYMASVIQQWSSKEDPRLKRLAGQLQELGLTSGVDIARAGQTEIELQVGRTLQQDGDFVNLADVGLGVSQVMPVLVSLLAAERNQVVYIEQPELHLHPKAQVELADALAEAAKRGVRVVVETHSALLLEGIQTCIAEKIIDRESVILHWFTRDKAGKTTVSSTIPSQIGSYGDWPEDFSEVQMDSDSRFLDAVEERERELNGGETPGD